MLPSSCSFCNHENPAGSNYCNECGSPLHLVPCECGAVNNVTDEHCHRCGAPVSGPPAPAPEAPSAAPLGDFDERLRALQRELGVPSAERAAQPGTRFADGAPAPKLHFVELEHPQAQMSSPGSPSATAPFAGSAPWERPERRHGLLAAGLALAIVAAVAAGAVLYDRYAPWLAERASALREPDAAAPSPQATATPSSEAADVSPRREMASAPPAEPLQIDDASTTAPAERDVEKAGSPAVSPAPAPQGADAPMASRAAGDAGEPATPTAAPPPPDPRCPPAVAALALCERMAHADRR
jgi:Double zinc ribbon